MKMEQTYQTSDIYIASYLLLKGLELQEIDRCDKQRVYFIFIDREDRPNLVRSFMCGQAEGNLPDFLYHFKRAKRLLYSVEV